MTYTDGYLRSGSSSYPGGTYTSSGRSCGSPSGLPRSNSLLMTCSSMRPARSADQGSTVPPEAERRAQTPHFHPERAVVRLPATRRIPRPGSALDIEEDRLAVTLQPDV